MALKTTARATAMDPPSANFPTMHSRLFRKAQKPNLTEKQKLIYIHISLTCQLSLDQMSLIQREVGIHGVDTQTYIIYGPIC